MTVHCTQFRANSLRLIATSNCRKKRILRAHFIMINAMLFIYLLVYHAKSTKGNRKTQQKYILRDGIKYTLYPYNVGLYVQLIKLR
jgi:hypothetical protein